MLHSPPLSYKEMKEMPRAEKDALLEALELFLENDESGDFADEVVKRIRQCQPLFCFCVGEGTENVDPEMLLPSTLWHLRNLLEATSASQTEVQEDSAQAGHTSSAPESSEFSAPATPADAVAASGMRGDGALVGR
ncbi:hypothetical protein COCOBI_03-3760 [Coccomyxa sp. Obi]|nr:hypothetical protein COCOBI_03-3760 [Coccomyxa sp. Obi]